MDSELDGDDLSPVLLGLDPGASGGIGWITQGGGDGVGCEKWADTDTEVYWQIAQFSQRPVFAYLELVGAMPKQGVSSTFKFGRSYGFLAGVLTACRIPFEYVRPVVWQKALGCLSGGKKAVTRAKAQRLFPQLGKRVIHATADALLIAEYGRVTRGFPERTNGRTDA